MHLLLCTVLTNVFLDFLHVELVFFFFYHSITWAIPSMYNLKLKSVQLILFKLCTGVYIHIEDVHLLLYSHKQRLRV